MPSLFIGNRQRGRVGWSAAHGGNDRKLEPHHDCVSAHSGKIFQRAVSPRLSLICTVLAALLTPTLVLTQ